MPLLRGDISGSVGPKAQVPASPGDYAARYAGRGTTQEGQLEQARRVRPRLWHTDWLMLSGMHRAIALLAQKLSKPGIVAIDFGCGSRPYEGFFTAAGVDYRGADFDGETDIAIDSGGQLDAADKSADLVLSFQVLEHVRDLDVYLGEARRVLRDDGTMVLSTHGVWLYHPHPEDHRRWTREGLTNDLTVRGFSVTECIPVAGPLAWTTMVRLTCGAYALRGIPVVGNALAGLLAVVMNLRALVEDAVTPAWVTRENACVYIMVCRRAGAAA